uniref:Uncharacterized protein n=1 Tax=Kuenenia stuttgartiensis TaxID=174633 RepID=Q1Q558_KUEST|nr:unknown protein [Candidatus Kuenenia stuttgartiensis]
MLSGAGEKREHNEARQGKYRGKYRDTSHISCLVWWNNKESVPIFLLYSYSHIPIEQSNPNKVIQIGS